MRTQIGLLLVGLLAAQVAAAADPQRVVRYAHRYMEALPEAMPGAQNDTPARVELGRKLFFDQRLSVNDTQSCSSCHFLEKGNRAGVDNLPRSPGARGKLGRRNAPTVLNAGWQFAQFWDGRAEDLVEQAKGPILDELEMAMASGEAVAEKLRGIDEYREPFAAAFPDAEQPITFDNTARAIAAFERTLRTESRFDDFMAGDMDALSEQEVRGLDTFIEVNCVSCHDGPLVGGGLFETLGVYEDYPNQEDQGLYEVTGKEDDRMKFKVAPLRNVALTGPYYHDGRVSDLDQVVREMAAMQLDKELSDQEAADIVAFLKALTGKELESQLE